MQTRSSIKNNNVCIKPDYFQNSTAPIIKTPPMYVFGDYPKRSRPDSGFEIYDRLTKKPKRVEEYDESSDDGATENPEEMIDLKGTLAMLASKKLGGFYNDVQVYRKENHIYFKSYVDDHSVGMLVRLIDEYNHLVRKETEKTLFVKDSLVPKPIILHISSYGGYLHQGLIAVDAIKSSKVPVYTVVEGYAASCGSLMSVVGVKRFMTKNSSILIHQLSGGCRGTFKQMEDDMINSKKLMEQIVKIYQENCNNKMTTRQIESALERDLFWGYDECKKRGLVDDVYNGEFE